MSFYTKYRPQKFSDLVGQTDLAETLRSQIKTGKFAHAYLFVGPKGTGKTTTARIIAKALNCESLKDGEPDDKCASCREITSGAFLDVIEIDAASNRGIDEVRDLREKIRLAPTSGRYKVFIIDEVHMLTLEAFNALLKTLEEPPAHAVFILCTTEEHKVPATIVSRTQRFEFDRATSADLVSLLKKVAKKEELKVESEVLEQIAESSDGSYRDALTILEQAAGGPVTAERVGRVTRRSSRVAKLLDLLEAENALGSVELVGEVASAGSNLSHFTSDLVSLMRRELLSAIKDGNDVRQLKLTRLIKLFSEAYRGLRGAVLPTLPLELAIVEGVGIKERIVAEVIQEVTKEAALEEVSDAQLEGNAQKPEGSGGKELDQLKSRWDELLRLVKPLNHSLEAFLRGCEPYEVSGKIVTLRFFYKFHKDMVDQPKNRELVEREMAKIVGREFRIKTILGEKSQAKRVIKPEEVKNVTEVADEDLVQKAVDIFNSGLS